ncbi:hypothetical protein Cme02nite_73590 [Catellatospora methionotrophica]|uniref:Uncharacterized protein n=1 Tax=Catellatospora methionotrophica TaxID=121620 RepID=A0A8J3LGQ6_9ACTN|nr:hypothetical protein [Catellatospora methionotrophica]GIG19027.1 hypothetical protein Cme02nite_73590 [Catellatospora methionotrophica]
MGGLWVGVGWFGLARRRVADNTVVFAVRRDWPDWRTHEFVAPRLTLAEAERAAQAEHAYWRRGPARPTVSVVRISANDLRIHRNRRDCKAPDCAVGASDRAPRPS